MGKFSTHGDGLNWQGNLAKNSPDAVIEHGVRIFDPQNVSIGANCYIGHSAHLAGYHNGHITIGDGTWIGAMTFIHGAAGVDIGESVGIGPNVTILTSQHNLKNTDIPVLHAPIDFKPVTIGSGSDIGAATVILPGVTIGEGAVIGAGSVVTTDIPPNTIAAGNPAREIRQR